MSDAKRPWPDEAAQRVGHLARQKAIIIAGVATVELGFDFLIEPWLRTFTGWEEVVERYLGVAEVLAIALIVWVAFTQLERMEARLVQKEAETKRLWEEAERRREELRRLYEASLETSRESAYPDVLSRIVEVAARLCGAPFGALAELEDDEVVHFVAYGVDPAASERIGHPPTHRGLLARLSGTEPVRIDDVRAEPDFTGFPELHPQVRSFLGVPIRWQAELLGHLYLGGTERGFREEDERILTLFAKQAAVAILRARMDRERQEWLRAEEAKRLAGELHDNALQVLYAVAIQLERAKRRGLTRLTDAMETEQALAAIEKAMNAIRGEMASLDRSPWESGWDELRRAVDTVAHLYGVELRWETAEPPPISGTCLAALRPTLAELVANAARHGGAEHVRLAASVEGDVLRLVVRDDGRGLPAGPLVEGEGLRNARGRLALLEGRLALHRGVPRGVVAVVELPVGRSLAVARGEDR